MTMNQVRFNPSHASTAMTAITESPLTMSEIILMGLRPTVSISCPPKIANNSDGIAMAVATKPAAAGFPVRSKTSHGHTTVATPLPNSDKPADVRYSHATLDRLAEPAVPVVSLACRSGIIGGSASVAFIRSPHVFYRSLMGRCHIVCYQFHYFHSQNYFVNKNRIKIHSL